MNFTRMIAKKYPITAQRTLYLSSPQYKSAITRRGDSIWVLTVEAFLWITQHEGRKFLIDLLPKEEPIPYATPLLIKKDQHLIFLTTGDAF